MRRFGLATRNDWRQRQPVMSGLQGNFGSQCGLRGRSSGSFGGHGVFSGPGVSDAAPGGRHLFTSPVIRCKNAVIAREIDARRRHQGGQAGHQVERFEYHVRGAVTVRSFQAVPNIPLSCERQPHSRDRRARDIAAQPPLRRQCRSVSSRLHFRGRDIRKKAQVQLDGSGCASLHSSPRLPLCRLPHSRRHAHRYRPPGL